MFIQGRLYELLRTRVCSNVEIALLIIDEEFSAEKCEMPGMGGYVQKDYNVTTFQQKILTYLQIMGCPVWSISMNTGTPGYDATRPALKDLYNGQQHCMLKGHTNAFRETNLHVELHKLNITHLVVMGWHSNACVSDTIGFSDDPSYISHDSATSLGYKVMTCDQILHGEPARWAFEYSRYSSNLEFYSHF
ncbi:MAG: isochorismatase family protein [Psychromonas sp.]|nr:isochorismatase family protein [Psychromonas sp.]